MKKTITVNLNGRVFTMDEDAFRLLDNYLSNLRIYFRKEEGSAEIIADFEARIEELFSEKVRLGYQVITIEHVEEVIARVGKPDDFVEQEDEKEEKQAHFTEQKEAKKKFFRNTDDKMFGGICSGIAAFFGWDIIPVRIIFIILIFATQGLIVPCYLIAWIVFPNAKTAEEKLQMRGKPITVENIGKTVAAEAEPSSPKESKGCLAGFIELFVGLMKVFMIGLGCIIGFPLIIALFVVIVVLIALLFGAGTSVLGLTPSIIIASNPIIATIAFIFVLGIPIVALIYVIIAYFAKLNPINSPVRWVFLSIWILALILFLTSGFRIDPANMKQFWNWNVYESDAIKGNGNYFEKTCELDEPVRYVEIDKNLNAVLNIEQIEDENSSVVISGDENLVEQVRIGLSNGRLILSTHNNLRSENKLNILLRTNDLKKIYSGFVSNIKMERAFTGDELEIKIVGPGSFRADSLNIHSLIVHSSGIASINLSGKANVANFDLSGTGKIDAIELLSDTVYAKVNGVGSIKVNPTEYLEGRLNGVGSIIYKEEPKNKNVSSSGVGKIKKI